MNEQTNKFALRTTYQQMTWIGDASELLVFSHNFCSELTARMGMISCPRSSFFQLSGLL